MSYYLFNGEQCIDALLHDTRQCLYGIIPDNALKHYDVIPDNDLRHYHVIPDCLEALQCDTTQCLNALLYKYWMAASPLYSLRDEEKR